MRYVHVRRALVEAGEPLDAIIEDINQIVRKRTAIVLADGQFLRRPISLDWHIERYFDDATSTPYDHPARTWSGAHRDYFGALWGICNPYQYGEDRASYDQFCIGVVVPEGPLVRDERILGIVDADRDERHVYCPSTCHRAEIVYTSRERLICMACGRLHCVMERPLARRFRTSLSADQWRGMFDVDGEVSDPDVPLELIDYREIAVIEPLWVTDAWLEATGVIDLYAFGTPEEIALYEKGLVSPEAFLEAGWVEQPTMPPPSAQFKEDGFGVNLMENTGRAIDLGASAYARSQTDPDVLREAILSLFQAIELTLKMRLRQIDPHALGTSPSNPQVIRKLQNAKVHLDAGDIDMIGELRRTRNGLQHAEATYSYRSARALLRRALVFLDRFCLSELDCWMGDNVEPSAWAQLLRLKEIQRNAEDVATARLAQLEGNPDYVVMLCPECGRKSLVRARLGGSECLYCRHRPVSIDGG